MNEPIKGIDVGAKAEIYQILKGLRNTKSNSIILVPSEISEIIAICDRVIVMTMRKIAGEVTGSDINKDKILNLAFTQI